MTLKMAPKKNQSSAFLLVFCAHKAQKAPNKIATPPVLTSELTEKLGLGLLLELKTSIRSSKTCICCFNFFTSCCNASGLGVGVRLLSCACTNEQQRKVATSDNDKKVFNLCRDFIYSLVLDSFKISLY